MFLISSCTYKKIIDSKYYCEKLNLNCVNKNQLVSFETSKGIFEVELYGENNPVTVSNFIENVKKNIYRNKSFYKIINYPQVKVIHSGIYSENKFLKKENKELKKLHQNIPLEIKLKEEIEPIYRFQIIDPSEISNLKKFFKKGSLAMVKNGKKNSSATEFFFVTSKMPELDGRYSVFGIVTKGFEVLEKLNSKDFIYEISITN